MIEKKDTVLTPLGEGRCAAIGNDFPAAMADDCDMVNAPVYRYSGRGAAIVVDLFADDGGPDGSRLYTFHAEQVTLVSKHVKQPWEM